MERTFSSDAGNAARIVRAVAELYEQGAFEIGDDRTQTPVLKTLLMSDNVIENLVVVGVDDTASGLTRTPDKKIRPLTVPVNVVREQYDLSRPGRFPKPGKAVWLKPVILHDMLFHNVASTLTRDGEVRGMVVASVGAYNLNRIVSDIGAANDARTFMLNDSYELIANSVLPGMFRSRPKYAIEDIPDTAVKAIAERIRQLDLRDSKEPRGFLVKDGGDPGGKRYAVMARSVSAMSDRPYVLAAYLDAADLVSEIRRVLVAAAAGFVALVLSVVLAVIFGNRLSKPLTRVADTASRFARLDLGSWTPLPGSTVREIDDQSRAMNAMHTALTEFGHYVPRELVRRLLHSGTEATRSVERDITVMFTDVAGFTAMSEHMSAGDVLKVLNGHFEILCREIEACHGTVDKFMGDGLMAFWGAPEADADHAENAIEAVRRIVRAFEADNRSRVENGLPPLRLRIGVHTGRAVVGNIGSRERQNYTVVGDIVNVAARLEQLGKEEIGEGNFVALVSGECRTAAGAPHDLDAIGSRSLRGRKTPVTIFMLNMAAQKPALNERPDAAQSRTA